MRRAPHDGQNPRRLQLNASSLSWPHSPQRRRRKPWARIPHSRNASNSSLMNRGSCEPVAASVCAMKLAACCCTSFVSVISNIVVDGRSIDGLGAYESIWHTDMSYNPHPPYASFLFSIEVPASGGDTGFANMAAAYDALSPDMKARIEGLSCRHDASRNSAGELRRGFSEVSDPRETPGAACISGAVRTPTFPGCRSMRARRCSTRCGRTRDRRASSGTSSGGSATW